MGCCGRKEPTAKGLAAVGRSDHPLQAQVSGLRSQDPPKKPCCPDCAKKAVASAAAKQPNVVIPSRNPTTARVIRLGRAA